MKFRALFALGLLLGCIGFVSVSYGASRESETDADSCFQQGRDYYAQGRYKKAVRPLKKAVKLKPGNLEAWRSLGDTYYRQQKFPEALKAYEEVLRLRPDDPAMERLVDYLGQGGASPGAPQIVSPSAQPQMRSTAWYAQIGCGKIHAQGSGAQARVWRDGYDFALDVGRKITEVFLIEVRYAYERWEANAPEFFGRYNPGFSQADYRMHVYGDACLEGFNGLVGLKCRSHKRDATVFSLFAGGGGRYQTLPEMRIHNIAIYSMDEQWVAVPGYSKGYPAGQVAGAFTMPFGPYSQLMVELSENVIKTDDGTHSWSRFGLNLHFAF